MVLLYTNYITRTLKQVNSRGIGLWLVKSKIPLYFCSPPHSLKRVRFFGRLTKQINMLPKTKVEKSVQKLGVSAEKMVIAPQAL